MVKKKKEGVHNARNNKIRKLYRSGLRKHTMRNLAARFGLSASMVHLIVKGRKK